MRRDKRFELTPIESDHNYRCGECGNEDEFFSRESGIGVCGECDHVDAFPAFSYQYKLERMDEKEIQKHKKEVKKQQEEMIGRAEAYEHSARGIAQRREQSHGL